MKNKGQAPIAAIALIMLVIVLLIALGMVGWPQYNVYSSRKDGEAKLAHADFEREVQVRDAKGKFEASTLLANAEIERAKGVARANEIIGDSLKNNKEYLKWLYIEGLREKSGQVIYVPTEAGIPILEAGKR